MRDELVPVNDCTTNYTSTMLKLHYHSAPIDCALQKLHCDRIKVRLASFSWRLAGWGLRKETGDAQLFKALDRGPC